MSPGGKGSQQAKDKNAVREHFISDAESALSVQDSSLALAPTEHWTRTKTPPPQPRTSITSQISLEPRPRRSSSNWKRSEKKFGKMRQYNFGLAASTEVVYPGDVAATGSLESKAPLPEAIENCTNVDNFQECKLSPDEIKAFSEKMEKSTDSPMPAMCEMLSKDTDPKRSWVMTIPNSTFGADAEWGLLRDAQVRFEPDRIIVEAHDRFGHSRIIHCSEIPRRLDIDESTYKVDPNGYSVQITIKTAKSPRTEYDEDSTQEKVKDKKKKGILSLALDKPVGGGCSPSNAKDFL